jgi:hypothetical protein
MPFDPALPRTFNAISIRAYAPTASGVYGLSNARAWLLIGETDNVQAALLEHLRDDGEKITGFCCETHPANGRTRRQEQLVQEYHPEGNRR